MTVWSLRDYCETQQQQLQLIDDEVFPTSTKIFLETLALPSIHPFCVSEEFVDPTTGRIYENDDGDGEFWLPDIPPMGTLSPDEWTQIFEHDSLVSQLYTVWCRTMPVLLAMTELWLRLFAGFMAPIGVIWMTTWIVLGGVGRQRRKSNSSHGRSFFLFSSSLSPSSISKLSMLAIVLTVASSLVIMTDTLYVLEFGPSYGSTLFVSSVILSFTICYYDHNHHNHDKHHSKKNGTTTSSSSNNHHQYHLSSITSVIVMGFVLLAIHLVWDLDNDTLTFGNKDDVISPTITEGLHYNTENSFVRNIVSHWSPSDWTYSVETGATSWMPTGDARTGLPFLLNKVSNPNWYRVFLQVDGFIHDPTNIGGNTGPAEFVALDISFPTTAGTGGYDPSKPVYMILHGLNGGSNEEYVRDFTIRRNAEGSTVVVMVARGLMDLPVRGWNIFHGARTNDAAEAAAVLRRAVDETAQRLSTSTSSTSTTTTTTTTLIGVGYSMGAIVLNNYVASYGTNCRLDGAISFSGGLDMRYQENFPRAQRLWQPMLAEELRETFLLNKWGRRVRDAIPHEHFLKLMRATHVTEIDRYAVVSYNKLDDLDHYYRLMSALGDIPHNVDDDMLPINNTGKIHSVSIPIVVVQALDDPLITWRATVQNDGFMHPTNLIQSGSGNLMILLTKAGGHVGWSTGFLPFIDKWKWMSNVAGSFGVALDETKKQQ